MISEHLSVKAELILLASATVAPLGYLLQNTAYQVTMDWRFFCCHPKLSALDECLASSALKVKIFPHTLWDCPRLVPTPESLLP